MSRGRIKTTERIAIHGIYAIIKADGLALG